jgi:hypothetical protein
LRGTSSRLFIGLIWSVRRVVICGYIGSAMINAANAAAMQMPNVARRATNRTIRSRFI